MKIHSCSSRTPPGTRCTRAASAQDAGRRSRASGRSTRSARRHEGNTKREGRACRVRWGDGRRRGADADGVRPRQARPSRVLDLYDNPIISRPLSIRSFSVPLQWVKGRACRVRWGDGRRRGADATSASLPHVHQKPSGRDKRGPPVCLTYMTIRSFPVPLQWMKQCASQPQNQSPCPRASARSVLTDRRPRAVPAPPRRVALGGGPEPPAGQHGARGGTKEIRNGRDALVASDGGGTDADGVRPRQARPSRVLDLYDNPIISRSLSIRSFPVPLQWVKQRTSQPQNQSPCPRVSARSVLTDRRPRAVPAPPRRGTLGGGPEPPAGQHGARGDTKEIRNGRDALVASDGGTDADGVRTRQARPSRMATRNPPAATSAALPCA